MSLNPYIGVAKNSEGQILQEFPAPKLALQRFTSENATVSSVISFTHDTTTIEVAGIGGSGAAIKWIPTSDGVASIITIAGSTSNYDHVVPAGQVRRFAVPQETIGGNPSSVQGANRANGLYQRVAYKTFGVGSVMLSEFGLY